MPDLPKYIHSIVLRQTHAHLSLSPCWGVQYSYLSCTQTEATDQLKVQPISKKEALKHPSVNY
jgi:hypothetical protein